MRDGKPVQWCSVWLHPRRRLRRKPTRTQVVCFGQACNDRRDAKWCLSTMLGTAQLRAAGVDSARVGRSSTVRAHVSTTTPSSRSRLGEADDGGWFSAARHALAAPLSCFIRLMREPL